MEKQNEEHEERKSDTKRKKKKKPAEKSRQNKWKEKKAWMLIQQTWFHVDAIEWNSSLECVVGQFAIGVFGVDNSQDKMDSVWFLFYLFTIGILFFLPKHKHQHKYYVTLETQFRLSNGQTNTVNKNRTELHTQFVVQVIVSRALFCFVWDTSTSNWYQWWWFSRSLSNVQAVLIYLRFFFSDEQVYAKFISRLLSLSLYLYFHVPWGSVSKHTQIGSLSSHNENWIEATA